jgi:type IV fimbrial biogenesis protein FimT
LLITAHRVKHTVYHFVVAIMREYAKQVYMMKKVTGFTLVEMMITLTVMVIVLAVGVPSFIQISRNNSLAIHANELVAALNMARSEAVKRGEQVTVAPTVAEWEDGWHIFTDGNDTGTLDAGELELQVYDAIKDGYTLRTGAHFNLYVAYLPTGMSKGNGGANDTFRLCADNQDTAQARAIIINLVGRIRTEQGTALCP